MLLNILELEPDEVRNYHLKIDQLIFEEDF